MGRDGNGILLAGRLLLAAALLPAGIAHALNPSGFALTLAGTGMPAPNAVATASIVIAVFGPLALAAGVLPRLVGWTLALHTLVMGLLLHRFWDFSGGTALVERELFLAQAGLAGGLILGAVAGPGAWSWHGWRHGVRAASAKPAPKGAAPKEPAPKAAAPRERAAGPRAKPARAAA
ncbi:DoxX family protein [Methylobacterium isbiliense]|uniref:DoxX family protein n=1 Tax=Methylobacterium isbiliense TaxID=315478 RepID=UPI0025B55E88|nr:DoxX family protein [Methylobacterium isbiliense]MDN3622336.1 DoxX family protein [Methylobacterium isbiliense]